LFVPAEMAFQPVPEPSALGLLALGAAAFLMRCRMANSVQRTGASHGIFRRRKTALDPISE